jgi:citrate synthase
MTKSNYTAEVTPEIKEWTKLANEANHLNSEMFIEYDVRRGLRDLNGKGVLAGLTNISDVKAKEIVDGKEVPCHGQLFYRGMNVKDLIGGIEKDNRFGFEEATYLLLFGSLPDKKQLDDFTQTLAEYRNLPTSFVRDIIMKAPSKDMMNTLARSVLTLYSYDPNASDISLDNVLRQSLQLISLFPLLSIYGYQAYSHYHDGKALFINKPNKNLSTSENILHLLRKDGKFTPLEAKILDIALILHMEHGGGNNSSFTTHVVTSSYTDTYSTIAAAIGSLKGPRHGGANIHVTHMFDDLKSSVEDLKNEEQVSAYLQKILDKEAYDKTGLIYGVGHAVYSKSDPRAILKDYVKDLSKEKGLEKEFELYEMVERLATDMISKKRKIYKGVSVNVDFYSGFVYRMLNLPEELYTPIFAIARIVGWSAHRMEELANQSKIIRPAYKPITPSKDYVPLNER